MLTPQQKATITMVHRTWPNSLIDYGVGFNIVPTVFIRETFDLAPELDLTYFGAIDYDGQLVGGDWFAINGKAV